MIHNLPTEFRLQVAIVHTRDFKYIVMIFAQIARLDREILMRVRMYDLIVRICWFSAMSIHLIETIN